MLPPNHFPPRPTQAVPHAPAVVRQAPVVHYTFLLVGISLLVYVLRVLDDILLPLLFSALLSVLLLPLVRKLESWKWPRILAIITAILLVVLGLSGLFYFFGTQLMSLRNEWPLIQKNAAQYFEQLQQWASHRFGYQPLSKDELLDKSLGSLRDSAGSYLSTTLSTTAGVLSTVTLVPIYIFCFLYYRDHMRQFLFRFVTPDKRTSVLHTMDSIQTVVQAYISGLLTVIVVVSILNGIGLLALGVKYAVFFAIFASVLAVIPYIGIMVGATIPALITLVETGSPARAAAVVGVFVLVQFLEGNFITPMITGSKVSINPMAAIVALILGGELWGTPGMILSIPLIAVIKVVFDANKATEPWGFLLGDVADADEAATDPAAEQPGWLAKAWRMVRNM